MDLQMDGAYDAMVTRMPVPQANLAGQSSVASLVEMRCGKPARLSLRKLAGRKHENAFFISNCRGFLTTLP